MFKGYSLVAFTAAIVVVATTLPVQAGNLPFDTTEIDQYLLIGMTDSGTADAVNVSNGELGAHKAGAPFDEDFTDPSSTFPGQLIGNVPDIPLTALPVFGGIDHSGNIAITNNSGDIALSNVGIYANLGVQTADDASTALDATSGNYFYYDTTFTDDPNDATDGQGGFTNTLDSFTQPNATNNNTVATGKSVSVGEATAFANSSATDGAFILAEGDGLTGNVNFNGTGTGLNDEILAAKTLIPLLDPDDPANNTDGMGNPIHFANIDLTKTDGKIDKSMHPSDKGFAVSGDITASVSSSSDDGTFLVTLTNPGLTVIDFTVPADKDIEVNTYNFVIDGPPGSTAIFRIPDGTEFATSNGNVLAGDGGIGLNNIIFFTLNQTKEEHFDFDNSVLNGVAFWSLTMVNGSIEHNNTQGCAQFIGDIINMQDVRFVHCKDTPPCCGNEIPEPATMTLGLLAVCSILSRRRRLIQ